MKTRIAKFHNCEGVLFFRPQWKVPFLPIWITYTFFNGYYNEPYEFNRIDGCVKFFENAQSKTLEIRRAKRYFIGSVESPTNDT